MLPFGCLAVAPAGFGTSRRVSAHRCAPAEVPSPPVLPLARSLAAAFLSSTRLLVGSLSSLLSVPIPGSPFIPPDPAASAAASAVVFDSVPAHRLASIPNIRPADRKRSRCASTAGPFSIPRFEPRRCLSLLLHATTSRAVERVAVVFHNHQTSRQRQVILVRLIDEPSRTQ